MPKNKDKKIIYYNINLSNDKTKLSHDYTLMSSLIDDEDFESRINELMSQELIYGDVNYY